MKFILGYAMLLVGLLVTIQLNTVTAYTIYLWIFCVAVILGRIIMEDDTHYEEEEL